MSYDKFPVIVNTKNIESSERVAYGIETCGTYYWRIPGYW